MDQSLPGQVFLSHSSVDKSFVRKLTHRIEKEGFRVWLDEKKLIAGDPLGKTISEALDRASVVLVVVSKASVKSRWLSFELNKATERMVKGECRVIPVVIEKIELPAEVKGLMFADFTSSFKLGFKAVLTALQHEARHAGGHAVYALTLRPAKSSRRSLPLPVGSLHSWATPVLASRASCRQASRSVGSQDRVVARVRRGGHVRPRLAVFRTRYHSCHCRGRRCGRCRGNHQIFPLFRARTTLGSAVAALIDNGASQPQKIRPGQAEPETFSAPEVLEPVSRQLGVTHRVLDVLVAEPSL
jgi:hypothetical protein